MEQEVYISTRVSKVLHAEILKRQKEAKRKTGFEPTVSAVVRAMLEEAARSQKMSLDVFLRKVVTEERDVFEWMGMTHNMAEMAEWAGIHKACWRPEELGITEAGDLIPLLRAGLIKLEENPDEAKKFNPPNGWGDYHGFVAFVRRYLEACREHPDAKIKVSR